MTTRRIHASDLVIFTVLLGSLVSLIWIGWSTWQPTVHEIECRDIRSEYLGTEIRVDRLRIESRFNDAGCTGSLLNIFLPASH